MTYTEFLKSKIVKAPDFGIVEEVNVNPALFPHQADICRWAIRGGRRAIFAAFGLGKTVMQVQICESLAKQAHEYSLIVAPLGVRQEFVRDAKNIFGIEMRYIRNDEDFEQEVEAGYRYFITNYERVRDGHLNVNVFTVVSLDEASILRSFGSKTYQEFLPIFENVPYRFVATATPAPNRYKEIIHYAGFLGVMDTGQALTRFFKRDPKKAGNLQIHPHKEREFWLWVNTWACFVQKPSDLGYSDEGYDLPPYEVIEHRLEVDHSEAGADSWGQIKMFRDASLDLRSASREKRMTLESRVQKAIEIIEAEPDEHFIIWTELNDEASMIERYLSDTYGRDSYVTAHGATSSADLDRREADLVKFSEGGCRFIVTKPKVAGSGCNFQYHCHRAIYLGVGYKFNDFIQSIHRIYRFQQANEVKIHLIYTESEDNIFSTLMAKWERHKQMTDRMSAIIQKFGLTISMEKHIERSMGIERYEVKGQRYTAVNNDNVPEMQAMPDNSVDLIITSWPFSNQYEYTPNYSDFGHNDSDVEFFEQMDYLTPEEYRALKPGRIYCLHVKDRVVFGHQTGLGFPTVNPFTYKAMAHMLKHGFKLLAEIIIDTDVVRENAQTYRLGWSEMCKDGTKMGTGVPEKVFVFRKPQTDTSAGYADEPVKKNKQVYSRARWQLDANSLWRSNGDRFLTTEQVQSLQPATLKNVWKKHASGKPYSYEEHVKILEERDEKGLLPSGFMLLNPHLQNENIWEDITRMRTLNTNQSQGQRENHTCPLQFDVVERLIRRYSNEGDLVLDPFAGLMTVPYCAIRMGRRGYGIELNGQYFADGVNYLKAAEHNMTTATLFDVAEYEIKNLQTETA